MIVTTIMRGVREQKPKKTEKKIQRERDEKKRYLRRSKARHEKIIREQFC
jgi:hypothetical protein